MSERIIFNCKDDFYWYKQKLDLNDKYKNEHRGEPEKYPAMLLESQWGDNPNGPYYYNHSFIYQQEITCDKCGTKKLVWPEVDL
jgi:hypothetical protein